MDEDLTPEEEAVLEAEIAARQYPKSKEEQSHFAYFKRVIDELTNIKTANLTADEIGLVKLPVRTNLEISQYCDSMGMKGFAEYFKKEAQIILGSSLSRDGFLNNLAVTQKRETQSSVRTKNLPPRTKSGLFRKKKPREEM
jgi:hypothetical protein